MPCFHCHVVIKLPASHSAFILGTKKTWPNKIKRRLGIPVATRAEANRGTAVRAGNARPKAWGKQRPDSVEAWQEWAFNQDQRDWKWRRDNASWLRDEWVKREIARIEYYRDHEASKERSRHNARATYQNHKHDPEWMQKRREQNKARHVANPEHRRAWQKDYIKRHPEKTKEWQRKHRSKPINRAYANMRSRIREVFKGKRSAVSVFGCSKEEFELHMQSQFTEGMHWNNYGSFWHIDHIIPLSHFDPYNEQHKRIANHWTNLRPLEAVENMRRGNRMKETVQIALPF